MNKDPKHPRDPDEEAYAALEYMRSIANDCDVPDWLSRMLNAIVDRMTITYDLLDDMQKQIDEDCETFKQMVIKHIGGQP